jgi:hypothetical protein
LARESERRQTARVSEPERPPSGGAALRMRTSGRAGPDGPNTNTARRWSLPHPLPPPIVHTRCCSVRYALTLGIAQCA